MNCASTTAVWLGLLALGCQSETEQDAGQISALSVQRSFEQSDPERAHIDSLLEAIRVDMGLTHFAGTLFRFDRDEAEPREYFLFMIPPPTYRGGEMVFVGLGGTLSSTPSFHTGVTFAPRSLSVSEIDDYDGDDLPDVAYCVWPQEESADGRSHAVGIRGGVWYDLPADSLTLPACSA